MTPLAQWLHDRGIGCRWSYISPFDIGLGKEYTPDHESGHEHDADALSNAIEDRRPRPFDGPFPLLQPTEESR